MPVQYKFSQFNHMVRLPESENSVLANFRTRRFVELDPFQEMLLEASPFPEPDSPFLKTLCEKGFLVREDEDEYESLREELRKKKEDSRSMHLTVCTTMRCNFACSYCIETGQLHPDDMSKEVQDAIIRFVKKRVEKYDIRDLDVIWFGGEPLLNTPVIERLSKAFLALSEEKGIRYHAGAYTNGYLLTEKIIRFLERYQVKTLRISIDGSREHHDRMRPLSTGMGTYDVIMDNLRKTKSSITYRIRCNLTEDNKNDYPDIVAALRKIARESRNTILCTPERVRIEKEVNPDLKSVEIPYPEYYEWYNRIKGDTVSGKDEAAQKFFQHRDAACLACLPNTFRVDVFGNLYKCNFFYGYEDHMIGNVKDYENESSFRTEGEYSYFKDYLLSSHEKCRKCVLLPLCLGRCPYMYLYKTGETDCHRFIVDLDNVVLDAYRLLKETKRER